MSGEDGVDYFVDALGDGLASAQKESNQIFEFGRTLSRSSLRRSRA